MIIHIVFIYAAPLNPLISPIIAPLSRIEFAADRACNYVSEHAAPRYWPSSPSHRSRDAHVISVQCSAQVFKRAGCHLKRAHLLTSAVNGGRAPFMISAVNGTKRALLKMLIQYDLPTKKTPNNIHECSA